jgi:kinetochore protein Mis12/MTW1
LHRLLQAEAARNAALISQLKSVLSPPSNASSNVVPKPKPTDTDKEDDNPHPLHPTFTFLAQKGTLSHSSAATPLSTTTAFALSQLPSLKALLAELRPAMKTLSSPPAARDPNIAETDEEGNENRKKSWRQQRLEYIETQTRKFHEGVRGLELGPQGEVRDGEWQDRGRRVGVAEVEALERVVALIGGKEGEEEQEEEMDEGA